MHLESTVGQRVRIPEVAGFRALDLVFEEGETIHTENSYKFTAASVKFTAASVEALLADSGFGIQKMFCDAQGLFAVTLATAIQR